MHPAVSRARRLLGMVWGANDWAVRFRRGTAFCRKDTGTMRYVLHGIVALTPSRFGYRIHTAPFLVRMWFIQPGETGDKRHLSK